MSKITIKLVEHIKSRHNCLDPNAKKYPLTMSLCMKVSDVGFPSVCCDYHWLIKELLWAYSKAIGE